MITQNSKLKSQNYKLKKVINRNLLLCFSIFTFLAFSAQKVWAVSFVFETKKDYFKEKEFTIKIKIDPKNDVIGAIDFNLIFDNKNLEIVEFNLENSIVSFWINSPQISENKISFAGGIPNGFRGIFIGTPLEANELIEVKFRKKREISKEEIEKSFNLKSEVFLNSEIGGSIEVKDFSFCEENTLDENFTILSGILYNRIKWKVEKVF
jgi:hypothetical protein